MKTFLDGIFGDNLPGLQKAMDLSWKRNEAISSNIANAETPGYRAVDVNFGSELERAFKQQEGPIAKTNPRHMDVTGSGESHLIPDYSGATKADGNNVDIDIQMGQLAFNKSKYAQAAGMIRKKMGILTNAIRQGGN